MTAAAAKIPSRLLRALQTNNFLSVMPTSHPESMDKNIVIKLQPNGQKYAELIELQWLNTNYLGFNTQNTIVDNTLNVPAGLTSQKRFEIFNKREFKEYINNLQIHKPLNLPSIIKTKKVITKAENTADFVPTWNEYTLLITDFIVHPNAGLEHFYNIQRARKIWWMRYSANPSRYLIEPYLDEAFSNMNSSFKSISIYSRFSFGNTLMEQVTIAPLADLGNAKQLEFLNRHTKIKIHPTVIRSVVNLEIAAYALLLDAFDHPRGMLLINRKLAPYQCAISCLLDGDINNDLRDLVRHITILLRRAGIRVYEGFDVFAQSAAFHKEQLKMADELGIPYILNIDKSTLENGLLGLRNRDTSLEEALHLSDIPNYLLNIFNN